jgi:hypothetical protein
MQNPKSIPNYSRSPVQPKTNPEKSRAGSILRARVPDQGRVGSSAGNLAHDEQNGAGGRASQKEERRGQRTGRNLRKAATKGWRCRPPSPASSSAVTAATAREVAGDKAG